MRTSDNTGGPAFPVAFVQGTDPHGADAAPGNDGMTLLDWFAGQALSGLSSSWYDRHKDDLETLEGSGPREIAQAAYAHADAMLAEKARREATGKDGLQVPDHSPDAGKTVWKQSPNMNGAIICETQFSDEHADDENVKGYGGFLVAESVPEEAKALIIRAPQLEAANKELVEFAARIAAFPLEEFGWQNRKDSQPIHGWNDYTLYVSDIKRARNLVAKHQTHKKEAGHE